jgi:hypothetical protein
MRLHVLNSLRIAGASVVLERAMAKPVRIWLLIVVGTAAAITIDDWWGSAMSDRLAIIGVIATITAAVITRFINFQRPEVRPADIFPAQPSHLSGPPLAAAELALAIEHIQSIRVLLGISSSYRQPVPHGVLVNLDLVLKHLRKLDHVCAASTQNGVIATARLSAPSGVRAED